MTTSSTTNPLDMKRTIDWYAATPALLCRLPTPADGQFPHTLVRSKSRQLPLLEAQLASLEQLFPATSRERSKIRQVIGQKITYFTKDSAFPGSIKTTTNVDKALSPTAIVPGYTDYSGWPAADIHLYRLPATLPPHCRTLVAAQAFLHEYGHTIIQPELYRECKLQLEGGGTIESNELILAFANLAEKHPPISHYASLYRNPDNSFKADPNDGKALLTSISEELTESIVAYLLGFAYCDDEHRREQPFCDRPDVCQVVENYLHAAKMQ